MARESIEIDMLVGVCVTSDDWIKNRKKLLRSIENISSIWKENSFFYIVIQGGRDRERNSFKELSSPIEFFYTEFMGVSRARNRCIKKANDIGAKFILFHDATIYWPALTAKFFYLNRENSRTLKVKLAFSDIDDSRSDYNSSLSSSSFSLKKVNPIYDTYVGSYLLNTRFLHGICFNEHFGPGQQTEFKSGEDVQFLFDFFSKKNDFFVLESSNDKIYHPPRHRDFSKHLLYASGQGRMFYLLLCKHISIRLLIDFVLFFGNAVVRCLFFKKNSFKILKCRIFGFFNIRG